MSKTRKKKAAKLGQKKKKEKEIFWVGSQETLEKG